MANIIGTDNSDILNGTSGNDTIKGGGGADQINAGSGNDYILGGAGADAIDGGSGVDTASYEDSNAGVMVNLGRHVATGGTAQGDTLFSIENLTGSGFDDTLIGDAGANAIEGGAGNDVIQGGGGADTLSGGAGNDTIEGGSGADTLHGGDGADTLSYQYSSAGVWVSLDTGVASNGDAQGDTFDGFENLIGSAFDDILVGNTGANVISGGAGNDTIFGDTFFPSASGGDDTIEGGAGADMMDGGAGIDTLSYQHSSAGVWVSLDTGVASNGDAQGDSFANFENLTGSAFDDILVGNTGANIISGGAGNDSIFGDTFFPSASGGDDTIEGGAGADMMDGGAGIDTLSYQHSSAGVWVSLDTGVASNGDAQGDSFANFENLTGSGFDDILVGNTGANIILGGGGNDTIFGDTFFPSASGGNDTIEGGAGADMMDGGAGIDTLSYQHSSAGVWVSLDTGVTSNGDAQGDSFANFENLTGSAFDDILVGNSGVNVITGGAGNDTLVGDGFFPTAMSSDTFVFDAVGFGKDIVGDFTAGQDHLQIDHTIFASFAAVQSHMTQAGADTVITFDANNSITLWNVQMASLHAGDFLFV